MKLKRYLDENAISDAEFAEIIGVHQTTVSRYVRGLRIPKHAHIRQIMLATGGQVTANDFVEREDIS